MKKQGVYRDFIVNYIIKPVTRDGKAPKKRKNSMIRKISGSARVNSADNTNIQEMLIEVIFNNNKDKDDMILI